MKQNEMIKKLRGFIYSEFKTITSYAESKVVSRAFISAILLGNKQPTSDILEDIGLVKVRENVYTYEPIQPVESK